MIGGGARGMIERALIAEGRSLRDGRRSSAVRAPSSPIMPRISPTTRGRFRSSSRCSIAWPPTATGSRSAPTSSNGCRMRLLDTLNLTRHFAAICGQDTFGMQKPDPEVFRATICRPAASPGAPSWSAIPGPMCAPPAPRKVPVMAVDFGYSEVPIATLRPDRMISSYSELRRIADLGHVKLRRSAISPPKLLTWVFDPSSWTVRSIIRQNPGSYLKGHEELAATANWKAQATAA